MSDFEKTIIDSCIADKKNIPIVINKLSPMDFNDPICRKAFIVISNLFRKGDPVTVLTLSENNKDIPAHLFGDGYIEGENLDYYISKVKDQGNRKRQKGLIGKLSDIVDNPELEANEVDQIIQDKVFNYLNKNKASETDNKSIGDLVLEQYEENKRRREDGEEVITLPTGTDELDNTIGGLQKGTLMVIGGRQGFGKSTLAMDILFGLVL